MRKLIVLFCSVTLSLATTAQSKNTSGVTGILGAFPDEIAYLLTQVQQPKDTVIQQAHFTRGMVNGKPVIIAQTGIGKVNAAVTTILMLEHFHPREIIFTGIAGAINPTLLPGDLVIGTKVGYHDYGAVTSADGMVNKPTRNPYTFKENPLYFNSDSLLVVLAKQLSSKITLEKIDRNNQLQSPQIISGTIVTGDVFMSSDKGAKRLQEVLGADATEMEGAAVAQVCYQQQTPFIVIRSMSDNANTHAHADFASFTKVASHNSAKFVIGLLGML